MIADERPRHDKMSGAECVRDIGLLTTKSWRVRSAVTRQCSSSGRSKEPASKSQFDMGTGNTRVLVPILSLHGNGKRNSGACSGARDLLAVSGNVEVPSHDAKGNVAPGTTTDVG